MSCLRYSTQTTPPSLVSLVSDYYKRRDKVQWPSPLSQVLSKHKMHAKLPRNNPPRLTTKAKENSSCLPCLMRQKSSYHNNLALQAIILFQVYGLSLFKTMKNSCRVYAEFVQADEEQTAVIIGFQDLMAFSVLNIKHLQLQLSLMSYSWTTPLNGNYNFPRYYHSSWKLNCLCTLNSRPHGDVSGG